MITGGQIRAARAMARLSQAELADIAGVSVETVKRLERIDGPTPIFSTTESALLKAFRKRGIVFIAENGGGLGVRFERPAS